MKKRRQEANRIELLNSSPESNKQEKLGGTPLVLPLVLPLRKPSLPETPGNGRRCCQGSGRGTFMRGIKEMCSGTEAGSYLRLIDSCITQLKAQGPARTCNESKEEEEEASRLGGRPCRCT